MNVQLSDPHVFVAFAFTVVVPIGKKLPDAGTYVNVGAGLPVAVALKLTDLPQESVPLLTTILVGQVITGGVFTDKIAAVDVAAPHALLNTA